MNSLSENIFTARTLDDCLNLASSKLNISKNDLEYNIIEEKQGIFIKKVTVSVKVPENIQNDKKIKIDEVKEKEVTKLSSDNKNIDGTIKIQNGKIIVKNHKDGGRPATIRGNGKVKVLVDGIEVTSKQDVHEQNSIEIIFEENVAERMMNINISHDSMEAYASIKYIPENIYKLKDTMEQKDLEVEAQLEEQKYPNPYTIDEIKEILLSKGIKVGVIKENLYKLVELQDVEDVLIAKGRKPIQSIDDRIDIKFDVNNGKAFKEDKNGNVDYKSIGRVKEVKKGEVLAVREPGVDGKDGIDVKGCIKKHAKRKKANIKLGQGCEFKDDNTVISTIEGKPTFKGGVIAVHPVHNVEKDVDITTGNIDFVGDVVIYGSVKEGMRVDCGQNLTVNKNIEHAKLYSKRDMTVLGNVINSDLHAGGEDILKRNKLKVLKKLNSGLLELISTVDHIKKFNLLGKKVRDGEIVKVLIENKFKYINSLCSEFNELLLQCSMEEEKVVSDCINKNLVGVGPLNIKEVNELNLIVIKVKRAISAIETTLSVPVTMNISYCQDSVLKCSGNVIVTGKGEYVSEIISHGSVEFISSGSLARGGVIKAKKQIKCKKVGSEGGVSTKLIVEGKGHIWVDVAYQNTRFIVGEKEYILEVPSKEIHAYLADDGELVVDKFVL
ncbi:flagellar assembly protein A [Clostridium botulinum]|uniref:flagellar assembly protein A n=1 Tax=Clostridium botulinum TaxID=1491 RepID=UPI0006A59B3F|nr:flagellar assembly protein A [Clostridium botulinum]